MHFPANCSKQFRSLSFSEVPTRVLSDKEQKQLLYRRQMQFGTGDAVTPLVPSSIATQLATRKSEVVKALRDFQGKTSMGSLQQLMMQHFKESANPLNFYSLPLDLAKSLPITSLSVASTSMLSIKGKPVQPPGTLPLEDEDQFLPLANRPGPIQDLQSQFLEPLQDDLEGTVSKRDDNPEDHYDLKQLVDYCSNGRLLVFKVADKNPHRKKRVLGSVDNIISGDFAVRLYKLNSYGTELSVAPTSSAEVPLIRFFSMDPNKILDHMWCWRLDPGLKIDGGELKLKSVGRAFQQRLGCPLTFEAVDLERGIKPTSLELFLFLRDKGWTWDTWRAKALDLKRVVINFLGERKVYYGGNFFYMLCLVTLQPVADKCRLMHGQLETYYWAAFMLARASRWDELQNLSPDRPAKFYRIVYSVIHSWTILFGFTFEVSKLSLTNQLLMINKRDRKDQDK